MSVPQVPNDGFIYDLKGVNGKVWWQNTGIKLSGGQTSVSVQEAPKLKKYMVIVAGQSNAQGSSMEPQLASEKLPNPKIKQFSRGNSTTFSGAKIGYNPGKAGDIIPALDPLQHHGISNINSIGFARTFCENFIKDNPNSEITIMPCALGGTYFRLMDMNGYTITWDKTLGWVSKNLYNEMIKNSNGVLSSNPDMEVLCVLYHQGESDIGNGAYPFKLQQLVRDTRNDLHNSKGKDIPFIIGTMLKSWRAKNSQSEYIHNSHLWIKWATDIGNTDCANFDHISGFTPDGLEVHFTADGLRQMGHGYYQKFKEMTSSNRSLEFQDMGVVISDPSEIPSWDKICKHLMKNECNPINEECGNDILVDGK